MNVLSRIISRWVDVPLDLISSNVKCYIRHDPWVTITLPSLEQWQTILWGEGDGSDLAQSLELFSWWPLSSVTDKYREKYRFKTLNHFCIFPVTNTLKKKFTKGLFKQNMLKCEWKRMQNISRHFFTHSCGSSQCYFSITETLLKFYFFLDFLFSLHRLPSDSNVRKEWMNVILNEDSN